MIFFMCAKSHDSRKIALFLGLFFAFKIRAGFALKNPAVVSLCAKKMAFDKSIFCPFIFAWIASIRTANLAMTKWGTNLYPNTLAKVSHYLANLCAILLSLLSPPLSLRLS